jgi:hypothetical protein
MEGSSITTQTLRARVGDQGLAWVAVVVIPPFLIAPALWNGYPLLQWDTGGYLARWYEGYGPRPLDRVRPLSALRRGFELLDQSRPLGAGDALQLTLQVLSMAQPFRLPTIGLLLILTAALPWLAIMLLNRHFRRARGAVAVHPGAAWREDFHSRNIVAVRLYRLRRGHP